MFQSVRLEERAWALRWPAAAAAVFALFVSVQILRVNSRNDGPPVEPAPAYTPSGSLVKSDIVVPARDFYSNPIKLNRTSRLTGRFFTPKIKSRVSVIVMREADLENWKAGREIKALAQTGFIPGGRLNLLLEAGDYLLVVDNRESQTEQSVYVDFELER